MFKRSCKVLLVLILGILEAKALENKTPASSINIGVIDSQRILHELPEAQKMVQDLSKAEAELNKKILASRAELQKAQEAKKSEAELKMMAEKFKLEIDPQAKKLEEDSAKRSDILEAKINASIRDLAKKNNYNIVLAKEVVLYGGSDLTNEVLKALGASSNTK